MAKPYPVELERSITLRDGTRMVIRPIRASDREIEKAFVKGLSAESRYFRFMNAIDELTEPMLTRFTQIDYDREMALVAVVHENGIEVEVGVARYVVNDDRSSCEFAVAIADAWQRRGVGRMLMVALMNAARARGLRTMEGIVMSTNSGMLGLALALGFSVATRAGDPSTRYVSRLLETGAVRTPETPAANVN